MKTIRKPGFSRIHTGPSWGIVVNMSEKMVKFVTLLGGLNLLEETEKFEENVVFSDRFQSITDIHPEESKKKIIAPCWADQGGLSSFLPLKKPSAPEVLQCFCECNDLDSLADDCIKSCCEGRMLEGAVGRKQRYIFTSTITSLWVFDHIMEGADHSKRSSLLYWPMAYSLHFAERKQQNPQQILLNLSEFHH